MYSCKYIQLQIAYVVFGEIKVEDMNAIAQQAAQQAFKNQDILESSANATTADSTMP
jgi:hypothetical protein